MTDIRVLPENIDIEMRSNRRSHNYNLNSNSSPIPEKQAMPGNESPFTQCINKTWSQIEDKTITKDILETEIKQLREIKMKEPSPSPKIGLYKITLCYCYNTCYCMLLHVIQMPARLSHKSALVSAQTEKLFNNSQQHNMSATFTIIRIWRHPILSLRISQIFAVSVDKCSDSLPQSETRVNSKSSACIVGKLFTCESILIGNHQISELPGF